MKMPVFPVEGGCQCGAVRYRLSAAPRGVYTCHCKDCQRFSGGTGTMSMIVNATVVNITKGEMIGFDKAADSGRTVRMLACPYCGTKIWNEPLSSPGLIVMKPGTLDDMSWAKPVGNIWTDSRAPWVGIEADVPNFPGQPASRQPLYDAYASAIAEG